MFILLCRGGYMLMLLGRGIYGIYETVMRLNIENDTVNSVFYHAC